jgi:hypothetical protein
LKKIKIKIPGRNVIKFVDDGWLCGRVVHWLLRGGTTTAPLAIVSRALNIMNWLL